MCIFAESARGNHLEVMHLPTVAGVQKFKPAHLWPSRTRRGAEEPTNLNRTVINYSIINIIQAMVDLEQ